jgi:hypothetical protein
MKAVLLYGCKTWNNSKSITVKLQVFINKSLRKILRIFWPDQITNKELWKCTKQPRIDLQIRKRKWGWLGHMLQKPSNDIARQALEWNPQGKRDKGRPRNTWRRTELEEAKGVKKTWTEIKTDAKDRVRWRMLVEDLCSAAEWWDLSVIPTFIYLADGLRLFYLYAGDLQDSTIWDPTNSSVWLLPSQHVPVGWPINIH